MINKNIVFQWSRLSPWQIRYCFTEAAEAASFFRSKLNGERESQVSVDQPLFLLWSQGILAHDQVCQHPRLTVFPDGHISCEVIFLENQSQIARFLPGTQGMLHLIDLPGMICAALHPAQPCGITGSPKILAFIFIEPL